MPRPHHPEPGWAVQHVDSVAAARILRSIYKEDIDDLDRYLHEQRGRGMVISEWPVSSDDDVTMMVCFVERVAPSVNSANGNISLPIISYQNRLLGLPVLKSSVFSLYSKRTRFTFAATGPRENINHVSIPSLNDFSVVSDENGLPVVEVDRMNTSCPLPDAGCGGDSELVILNDTSVTEGWTSIRMRHVKTNSDMISFVIDNIPDADREKFISEADEMGWTSVHWACYRDDPQTLDACMNKLTLMEQEDLAAKPTCDGRGWTLLHCAAMKDSGRTMKALMNKFQDEDVKWQRLVCKADNGKTALHIAVAEQNVKAVIILLDEASGCRDLLDVRDKNQLRAEDYTSESSLLGRLIRTSVEINGCSLHELAKRDDDQLVGYLVGNLCDISLMEAINSKYANGMTVMHVAAKSKSFKVLNLFLRLLSHEELMTCLCKQTHRGNTVLHVAAQSNNPASLHRLLCEIERSQRMKLIQEMNDNGETVQDVGCQYKSVVDTVKFHQWLLEQDLDRFFKKFNYSLFNVEIPEDKLQNKHSLIENRTSRELGYKRNINYDAATCLMYGDFRQAKELVTAALQVDPFCIHALCNKGIYLLAQSDKNYQMAEEVALKVLEQYSDENTKQRLYTKIDYAYWLAEVERTERAREQSCDIFEECIQEAKECDDEKALHAYCSYFYAKILVRMVKDKVSHHHDNAWYEKKVEKIVSQFLVLACADRKAYAGDLWLWIAEMQSTAIRKRVAHVVDRGLQTIMSKCSQHLRENNFEPVTCVNTAINMRSEYDYDRKFLMRIGKICLDIAYDATDIRLRKYWLEKALELSEQCSRESTDWYFMCASTCSQALLNLWAIEFYWKNKEAVEKQYMHRNVHDRRRGSPPEYKVLMFITDDYHHRGVLGRCSFTKQYLTQVKGHLQKMVEKNGWVSHGIKYARVKHLLGDPDTEIIDTFERALQAICNTKDRLRALQKYGLYYDISKDHANALHYYREAIKLYEETGTRGYPYPRTAKDGIWLIEQYAPRHCFYRGANRVA